MTVATTVVLPGPVAILAQSRVNAPPSDRISTRIQTTGGASVSGMSVSAS